MDDKFKSLKTVDDLSILNGHAFEEYLTQLFSDLGYAAEKTPGSGDYGADLILKSPDCKIAVQAKQYAGDVGFDAVKEIHFAKSFYGTDEAWVVCTHGYTTQAIEAASTAGVRLIDGAALEDLIGKAHRGERTTARDLTSGLRKAMERANESASRILLIEYVYALEFELCSPTQKVDADGRLSFSKEQAISLPNGRFDEAVRLGLIVKGGEIEGERRYSLNLNDEERLAVQNSYTANVKLYNCIVETLKSRKDSEKKRLAEKPLELLWNESRARILTKCDLDRKRLQGGEGGGLDKFDRRLLETVSAMEHAKAKGYVRPFDCKWITKNVDAVRTPQAASADITRARKQGILDGYRGAWELTPDYRRHLGSYVQQIRFSSLRGEGIKLLDNAASATHEDLRDYMIQVDSANELKANLKNLQRSLGSLPEGNQELEALEAREKGLLNELEECRLFSVSKKSVIKRQIEETRRELEKLRQVQKERAAVLQSIEETECELKSIKLDFDRSKLVNVFEELLAVIDEACRLDGVFALKECCRMLKMSTNNLGEEPPIKLDALQGL